MLNSNEIRSLELALGEIENALNSGTVSPETVKTCGGREYDGIRKLTDKILDIAQKIQGNPPGGGGGTVDAYARALAGDAQQSADAAQDTANAAATQIALANHTGNTSNPHGVTAAQTGALTPAALQAALEFVVQTGEDLLPPHPIPQGGIYIRYEERLS